MDQHSVYIPLCLPIFGHTFKFIYDNDVILGEVWLLKYCQCVIDVWETLYNPCYPDKLGLMGTVPAINLLIDWEKKSCNWTF